MKILWKIIIKKVKKDIFYVDIFKVDVQYPENLQNLHNDLSFLPERMKIENVEKLVANLHDKTECVMHIINWKQALKETRNSCFCVMPKIIC